ncbi:MAG: diguanylate cyclase [Acidobacteriaceae bacterium]|nr:diguanylate cyclase [Acidobacteriaceae bacterium]
MAALISGAVVGSLLLLLTYGMIFVHERQATKSRERVDHTREVIDGLDRSSRTLDQMEADQRFIRVGDNGELFERNRRQALALEAGALTLRRLVADNPVQSLRVQEFLRCTTRMRDSISSVQRFLAVEPDSFSACHQTLVLMRDDEASLLRSRREQAQKSSDRAVWEGIVGAVLSLTGTVGLFWFLIRSAIQRRGLAKHLENANQGLSAMVQQLEQQAVDLQLLALVRDELQLCGTLKEVEASAALFLSQLMPESSGAVCLINESRNLVERVATWGSDADAGGIPEVFALDQCCALRTGRARWQYEGLSEVRCGHYTGIAAAYSACLPLSAQGEVLGFVTIRCADQAALRGLETGSASLQQIVELTAMTIASLKLRVKLQYQSIRDPLTELYNRNFMEVACDRELRRAHRKQSTLAVFMLDVDHFKTFNDGLGHAAGDITLREVAEVFKRCVRAEDIICRYGGEEFAIILPEIALEIALERAEAIRRSVSEMRLWMHDVRMPEITISIGVAMYPVDGTTMEQLLRSADQALYQAKRTGRNKVLVAANLDTPAFA